MIKNIRDFIKSSSTLQLMLYPVLLSVALIFLWAVFSKSNAGQPEFRFTMLGMVLFLWGLPGLVIVLRREAPLPWPAKGWQAILYGAMIIVLSWPLTIVLFIKALRLILS
jgi:hypothetical protein